MPQALRPRPALPLGYSWRAADGAIVRSLDRDELLRALRCALDGLLREGGELAHAVEPNLAALLLE